MSTRKKEDFLGRPKTKVLGYLLFIFLPFPSTENIISQISGIPMQRNINRDNNFGIF